jgi:hypothetical protein
MFGFLIAIAFAAVRLYMLGHQSLYEGALYGGWFDTLTLIFWPGSFYLTIMVGDTPVERQIIVWSVAILFNIPIYGVVGWAIWRLAQAFNFLRR